MSRGGIISFIKQNWVAYLVGATIAVLLGLGLSFYLGSKWSTPESIRAARVASEQSSEGVDIDVLDPNNAE